MDMSSSVSASALSLSLSLSLSLRVFGLGFRVLPTLLHLSLSLSLSVSVSLSLASFDAMDTDLKKMMIEEPKAKNAKNQSLPPRRGGVMIRIFKEIAVAIGIREKHAEETGGGSLSSDSTTPAPTPTGYHSDALSET
ncbi:hypothetical protein I3760_13G102400 [Carya illinoinensis]|nr:hypothetical protein I3760_13G102400 [Carya illinoinensis]